MSVSACRNQRLSLVWKPTLMMACSAVAKVRVVATASSPPATR
ncbi:hypothetical protein RB199_16480 [Streptomyces libani]